MQGIVVATLLLVSDAVKAWSTDLTSYIHECSQDDVDFTFKLQYNNKKQKHHNHKKKDWFEAKYHKKKDWFEAKCNRSYSRCPVSDGTCLGNGKDWTAEQGETFEYLETRTFYCSKDSMPTAIYLEDAKGYDCARVLNKNNKPIDFYFNTDVDISSWWDGNPLHMTIIPFNADNGNCENPQGAEFDAGRAIAVWVSPYEGQTDDPGTAGAVYSDVSKNPEDCLNAPYFEVDPYDSNQMVSHSYFYSNFMCILKDS